MLKEDAALFHPARYHEFSVKFLYRSRNKPPYLAFLMKFYFPFCRVNIHIDSRRTDFKEINSRPGNVPSSALYDTLPAAQSSVHDFQPDVC
jgi:hypothetical protein